MCISPTLKSKCWYSVDVWFLNGHFWIGSISTDFLRNESVAPRGRVKQRSQTRFSHFQHPQKVLQGFLNSSNQLSSNHQYLLRLNLNHLSSGNLVHFGSRVGVIVSCICWESSENTSKSYRKCEKRVWDHCFTRPRCATHPERENSVDIWNFQKVANKVLTWPLCDFNVGEMHT